MGVMLLGYVILTQEAIKNARKVNKRGNDRKEEKRREKVPVSDRHHEGRRERLH